MTDNKMTAEQALEWLRTIAKISAAVASPRPLSFNYEEAVKFQAAVKVMAEALSAPRVPRVPRVPVAWMVTRDRDQSFPRLYVEKALAERVVSFVEVNPPAVLHPLYTLSPSPEPVAQDHQLIADLRARVAELEGYNVGLANESHERGALISDLRAEVEALRVDADRYRFIRGSFGYNTFGINLPCGASRPREQIAKEADDAIDAARLREGGGE